MNESFILFLKSIHTGDIQTLQRLIRMDDQSLHETDSDGRSLLMNAIAPELSTPEILRLLLRNGANPNHQDFQGLNAVHIAARNNKAEMLAALLDAGADPHLPDQFGNNPIWLATIAGRANQACMRILLDAGADPTVKNKGGISAIDLAKQSGPLIRVELLERRKPST
jgi:ankyrin repeat protein